MATIKFQSEKQALRLTQLHGDVLYRSRAVEDVAVPLVRARDEARQVLHDALTELGVPDGAKVILQDDGVAWAAEGEEWDAESKTFVATSVEVGAQE